MDMDQQEATLVDVTVENFTATTVDQPAVSSTPDSHSIQLYEPHRCQLSQIRRDTHDFQLVPLSCIPFSLSRFSELACSTSVYLMSINHDQIRLA